MVNKNSYFLIIFCSLIFFFIILMVSQANDVVAPALYVFGDSTIDVGNNNPFNTIAKSNYLPYGVDFPSGASGRPTNGHNIADFFAKWLGLNVPPAFRLVNGSKENFYQGLNYASSSAGILPETASAMFKCVLSLGEQVYQFRKTVKESLLSGFRSGESLKEHVLKSVYLVVAGVNDISLNFLQKVNSTNPLEYTSHVGLLVDELGNHLKDLYKLGARKFVVFEVEAFGCLPFYVTKFKPVTSKCVDHLNSIALMFNARLSLKLEELQYRLEGSTFVLGKYYDFTSSLVVNPALSGLKEASNPCCAVLPYGVCNPKKAPCTDRNSHAFFDAHHPTEAVYKAFAEKCFSGLGSCIPMNVKQLAML